MILFALLCSLAAASSVFALGTVEVGAIFILSFVGILLFWFLIVCIVLAGVIFWIWMFIDCLGRQDASFRDDKAVWIIILLFTSIIGAILYFFFVRRKLQSGEAVKKRKKQVKNGMVPTKKKY